MRSVDLGYRLGSSRELDMLTYVQREQQSLQQRLTNIRRWYMAKSFRARALVVAIAVTGAVTACGADNGARSTGVAQSTTPSSVMSDSSRAVELCNSTGRETAGDSAVLKAAFGRTAEAIRRWQETRHPGGPNAVSQFVEQQAPNEFVAVCTFDDGDDWAFPGQPAGPSGTEQLPPRNRIVVLATSAGAALDAAGYHDTPGHGPGRGEIPIEPPPRT